MAEILLKAIKQVAMDLEAEGIQEIGDEPKRESSTLAGEYRMEEYAGCFGRSAFLQGSMESSGNTGICTSRRHRIQNQVVICECSHRCIEENRIIIDRCTYRFLSLSM